MSNKQIRKSGPVQLPVSFLCDGAAAASPPSLFILTSFFVVYMVKVTGRGVLLVTKVTTLAAG